MKPRKSRRLLIDDSSPIKAHHRREQNGAQAVMHGSTSSHANALLHSSDSTSASTSFKMDVSTSKRKIDFLKKSLSKPKQSTSKDHQQHHPPSDDMPHIHTVAEGLNALAVHSSSHRHAHSSPPPPRTRGPPFKGMVICVSGIPTDHRPLFRLQIEELGGSYSSKMDRNVTHLVIPSPETTGPKVEAAHQWGIPVVLAQWVMECAQTRSASDLGLFLVPSKVNLPTKKRIMEPCSQAGLFHDYVFCIHEGFAPKQRELLASELEHHKAHLVSTPHELEHSARPKKCILAKLLSEDMPNLEKLAQSSKSILVTKIWIDQCILDNDLVKPSSHVLYQPLELKPVKELRQVKLSTTDFPDRENLPLFSILKAMGAVPTPSFAKLEHSYLIAKSKTSTKFIKAIEWGIPVVRPEWVFEMAHKKSFLSPIPYLLRPDSVLSSTVLCISSALKKMANIRKLAVALGATVLITYAKSCTHFIHQDGHLSTSNNKDFKQAKADGKQFVSPWWLIECNQQQKRLDTSEFHSGFKPNRQLSLAPPLPAPTPREIPVLAPASQPQKQQPPLPPSSPPPSSPPGMPPLTPTTAASPAAPWVPTSEAPSPKRHRSEDDVAELVLLNQALQSALRAMKTVLPARPRSLSAHPDSALPSTPQPRDIVISYDDPAAIRAKKKYLQKSSPHISPAPRLFDLHVTQDQLPTLENYIPASSPSSSRSFSPSTSVPSSSSSSSFY